MSLFLAVSVAMAGSAIAAVAPDEVLVRFRPGAPGPAATRALDELGGRAVDELASLRVRRVKLPPGRALEDALARLRAHPLVELAEPNMIVRIKTLPTDGYAPLQWSLNRISASQAWGASLPGADGSAGIIIAIVDSGVWSGHSEFAGKLVPGYNALDDSGNTEDDHGHGTGVASVAAAAGDNGGIVGVARNARIMPIRVLSAAGEGTEFSIVKGVLWAANHGARVINMSLGSCDENGCAPGSVTGAEAMEQAHALGAVLVAATGNEGIEEFSYPAGYPYVIGVGATDAADRITYYSNTGPGLDVVAPGGGGSFFCDDSEDIIAATLATEPYCVGTPSSALTTEAGTSFSSPIVAGLAAVLLGVDPGRSPDQIASLLQRTADQPAGHTSWNPTYGYGRVNMYRALTGSMAAPPAAADTGWAWPNPFSPVLDRYTTFTIPDGAGKDVRVSIYDQAGHLVWEAAYGAGQTAGMDLYTSSPIRWNGRDLAGRMAAGGVYLARITAGGTSSVKKIVLAP